MTRKKTIYSRAQRCNSIFLQLLLLWLTISLPVVNSLGLQPVSGQATDWVTGSDESSPLSASSEEKPPAPVTVNEEYLHHPADYLSPFETEIPSHFTRIQALYIAFHGELVSPPPEC